MMTLEVGDSVLPIHLRNGRILKTEEELRQWARDGFADDFHLRDGRPIETEEDYTRWIYEYLNSFSDVLGQESTPIDMFPIWIRVLVEWVDCIGGLGSDRDNAQALVAAIGELTKCLERVLALPPEDTEAYLKQQVSKKPNGSSRRT